MICQRCDSKNRTFVIFPKIRYSVAIETESETEDKSMAKKNVDIPIWEKANLTLDEAAEYCNIGVNKLREISNSESCDFVLWVGNRRLLKRKKLDEYLAKTYSL